MLETEADMRPATDGKNRYSAALRSLREEMYPIQKRRAPNRKRAAAVPSQSQTDNRFVARKRRRSDTNKFEVLADLDSMGTDLGARDSPPTDDPELKLESSKKIANNKSKNEIKHSQDIKQSGNTSAPSSSKPTARNASHVRGRRRFSTSIQQPPTPALSQLSAVSLSSPQAPPEDEKADPAEIILLDSNWLRNYIKRSPAQGPTGHCISAVAYISKTLNVVNFLNGAAPEDFNSKNTGRLCGDCNGFVAEMAQVTHIFEQSLNSDGYRLTAVIAINNPKPTGMSLEIDR